VGHERVGLLPRTKSWRAVIDAIGQALESRQNLAHLANITIENVRSRLFRVHEDAGVTAAFRFLVELSSPSSAHQTLIEAEPVIDLSGDPTPLQLAMQLRHWVAADKESAEYADLAQKAATDAIAEWTTRQKQQPTLFSDEGHAVEVWRNAQSAAGFCEVARLFFANFTERYLNYFLEREASATLPTVQDRERFASELRAHVEEISHHAFETSKIAQSFAAGWYNNHVKNEMPSNPQIQRFLATAFGKIREELQRERS
jgi:methionine-rich copper-binding protein CopC